MIEITQNLQLIGNYMNALGLLFAQSFQEFVGKIVAISSNKARR